MSGERGAERPSEGWRLARVYLDEKAALRAYEAATELLFEDDLDASVLRVTVNGAQMVVVLGEGPPPATTERLGRALGGTTEADLPEGVERLLRERRWAFKQSGLGFMERRSGL